MKTLVVSIVLVSLAGCAGFKLGEMHYCPAEKACTTQSAPAPAMKLQQRI